MTSSMQGSLRSGSARVGDARGRAPASHCTTRRRTDHPPNPGRSRTLAVLALAGGLGGLCGLAACAGNATPGRTGISATLVGEASERSVAGDWDDIDAAVEVALESAEVAAVGSQRAPDRVIYELVSIEGRPGQLVIARGESGRLTLSARIGRFGEPPRERRLLDAVARRLARLRGVDIAPLD